MIPRGIANRNPGNLVKTDIEWLGEVEGTDKTFETFDTAHHGIRALCKTLLAYQNRLGLKTVHNIINRYAPPSENDTDAYVKAVCAYLDVDQNQTIDLHNVETMRDLVKAIIWHENGEQPYSPQIINAAVDSAYQT